MQRPWRRCNAECGLRSQRARGAPVGWVCESPQGSASGNIRRGRWGRGDCSSGKLAWTPSCKNWGRTRWDRHTAALGQETAGGRAQAGRAGSRKDVPKDLSGDGPLGTRATLQEPRAGRPPGQAAQHFPVPHGQRDRNTSLCVREDTVTKVCVSSDCLPAGDDRMMTLWLFHGTGCCEIRIKSVVFPQSNGGTGVAGDPKSQACTRLRPG